MQGGWAVPAMNSIKLSFKLVFFDFLCYAGVVATRLAEAQLFSA